ncbi:MAG: archease [Anaerolineae bacterium]
MMAGQGSEGRAALPEGEFMELPHTADRAIWVRAATLEGLFVAAARGMFSLMADLAGLRPQVSRPVQVEGLDLEMLLVEWLNELLFLHEKHGELYCRFDLSEVRPGSLAATVWGELGQPTGAKVKAATYHELEVRQEDGFWQATVVFDV